jgi:hypothetical protein
MRTRWHWLRAENSELRVLDDTGVCSVAITHFDSVILALVDERWWPCARVIGDGLNVLESEFRQVDVPVLWSRIVALVAAGQLEGQGDFGAVHACRVRRRPHRARTRRR